MMGPISTYVECVCAGSNFGHPMCFPGTLPSDMPFIRKFKHDENNPSMCFETFGLNVLWLFDLSLIFYITKFLV
ncbi:hypothetical protein EUGRSUZ_C01633 [Eucalyptus grandis]|uniref:Uncharacterized protein n=2 Tax=Eucalyptus grandis TaxID=71139 RepID=A0ACC3LF55_EUCGR|nr:hypothetical protein EUGRSUZ_C01633 [Eucalyptus grandis]